jgi:hypothetical protein
VNVNGQDLTPAVLIVDGKHYEVRELRFEPDVSDKQVVTLVSPAPGFRPAPGDTNYVEFERTITIPRYPRRTLDGEVHTYRASGPSRAQRRAWLRAQRRRR